LIGQGSVTVFLTGKPDGPIARAVRLSQRSRPGGRADHFSRSLCLRR
jgi:hypothetical protein